MPDQQPENLPDIDAGLKELSTEYTAADLLRKEGQRKKLKVINRNQLKAQIQEWIRKAVDEGIADRAGSLSEAERDELMRQAEERVQEAMARSQSEESRRQEAEAERAALEQRVNQLAADHNASAELQRSIAELQERLQHAEMAADEAQQDVLAMEQDLENIQKIHQATRSEKEKLEETIRAQMMHTGGLVGHVMSIDSEYYGGSHQEQHPVPEDAPGEDAFYHDYVVGEHVLATLAGDLKRLREISTQQSDTVAAAAAEAGDGRPQLLDQDLALLEQLKAGSLNAVEVAAPVENLIEAVAGAREAAMALREDDSRPLTAVPDDDPGADPSAALQGAAHVVREIGAALANQRERADALADQSAEHERAHQALRENMVRTTALVQQVMDLDAEYYGGRHQEENPADEDAEGQEAFYHDFDVGAQVIGTLSTDLARLRALTKDQEKYSGLLDSDLALLEQLKAGSLHAVDVAEPVGNLVEALRGARGELIGLAEDASAAMGAATSPVQIAAVPDADEDPAEVLAAASTVARELGAALAAERKRIRGLKALADSADAARAGSEEELEQFQHAFADLCAALAEQARDFGVDVPEALQASDEASARLPAAREVLDALHRRLEEHAAGVDELSAALDAVAEETFATGEPDASGEEGEDRRRELVGALKQRVARLGEAYQAMRTAYLDARRRETARAADLRALAAELAPGVGDGSEALDADADEPDVALVDRADPESIERDAARGVELGGAIDGLIASLRERRGGGPGRDAVVTLVREVVAVADADEDMAEHDAVSALRAAQEDPDLDAENLVARTRDVIEVLAARRQVLAEDLAEAISERERKEAARADLADRVDQLITDLETERHGVETLRAEADRVAPLQRRVEELETDLADKDEAVLSGKEVIAHLSDKEKRLAGEIGQLRESSERAAAEARAKATRLAKAETANRQLTEALSEFAQELLADEREESRQEIEEARVELELALSELPAEDQADVPLREDLADDLAEAGITLIECVRRRESDLVRELQAAESRVREAEAALASAEGGADDHREAARLAREELERSEARLQSLRAELTDSAEAVAAKGRELSQVRDDLAGRQAELEAVQRRMTEQDEQIQALQADTSEADRVREKLHEVEERLRVSQEVERDLATSIYELAGWSGEVTEEFGLQPKRETERYTRSRSKLEKAVAASESGGATALDIQRRSRELADKVRNQGETIRQHLRERIDEVERLRQDNESMQARVSSFDASIAERENQIVVLQQEKSQYQSELETLREAVDLARDETARQKDLLLQARAALEEYKAREGERGGGAAEQAERLRRELEAEREEREASEERLGQLNEELEATIAGLRSQIEGFGQRIADRDAEIDRLAGELDDERSKNLDSREGQARLQALQTELDHEQQLRAELERQIAEFRGGVGEEISRASRNRTELQNKLSSMEEELAVARGEASAMRAAKDKLRQDLQGRIDKLKSEKQAEVSAREEIEHADRHLREELAGLRARLRTLTAIEDEERGEG